MDFIEERQLQQTRGTESGRSVNGPIFVSIGSANKLGVFLKENPRISWDKILVDDYDHKSYKETMGFERFDEITSIGQLRGLDLSKMVVPLLRTLGISKLFGYATKVPALAPLEGDLNWTELPEGGLRNGGTIVVGGSEAESLLYRWNDKIPGDVPSPSDVYRRAVAPPNAGVY